MDEKQMEEKIINDLLTKGNKQVVDWITKLDSKELYWLLAKNISYRTIIEIVEMFKKDFDKPINEWDY